MILKEFQLPGEECPVLVIWPTPREQAVLRLLREGLPSKEIAAQLGISPDTVRGYTSRLGRAVGADNRGKLMVFTWNNPAMLEPGGSAVVRPGPEFVLLEA